MTTEKYIPLHILKDITNKFSAHSRIGRGGYGDVYKGVYNEREIAVKLLHVDTELGLDDENFINEVGNLLRVEHPNIVQLVGYCYDIQNEIIERDGGNRFRQHIYRVLCFEYMQGGSLEKHLRGKSLAPNWSTRYNIIKGICEGLNYLHKCEPQILHLDLKPANILLDCSMEPILADFGLSRLFKESHTHVTKKLVGTRKYMPPEFIQEHIISDKNDVFSLGVVIIEVISGHTSPSLSSGMVDITQFVQKEHTNWKNIIEDTSEYISEELHQLQVCINIAMSCVDSERNKRPTVADILVTLKKTETHIPKRQFADVFPGPRIGPKTMATERDNIIKDKHQHFNSMPRDSFNTIVQPVSPRETSSVVEPTLIIGRSEEKNKILSILSESSTEEMAILPIYGIGGIGKTTLAQLVFNDTQFQGYSRVWIYVSQKFDLNKIGNSIISQLTNRISHIADTQMIHNRLGELFSGNSILIVLDDLWEQDPYKLDKLKTMLSPHLGSKVVIVTTRDEAIAMNIRRAVMPYKLEILTEDMCWTIIKQKSFFEDRDDKEQLDQIGRGIAMKCGGVALAAQSLGYTLRDMTSDQWESVRDSYIWNLSTTEDPSLRNHEVLGSLQLSYSHMHEHLQLCFSYFAVFQKGHNIAKYDLIHQWIALGLVGPSGILYPMQLCEKYVRDLLGMSFLQYSKTPLSDEREDKYVTLFTMHDLVHDLARSILGDKVSEEGNVVGSSCHYALLTDCTKPLQLPVSSTESTWLNSFFNPFQKKSYPENIKALHFVDCAKQNLHVDAFSQAKSLHILNLSGCVIQELPDSISQMKQLRFLRAPRIQDHLTPNCIIKLTGLNYLNLRDSNMSELPVSIGDIKGLMHLDLSGCSGISELPVSFAELKQLVHLNLSRCMMPISESFGGFMKLQYLNLLLDVTPLKDIRRGLTDFIGNLTKLRYLNLSGCLYTKVPSANTQIVGLLDSMSTHSNLEHLDLSENHMLSFIPESIGNLRKVHTLDLSGCYHLEKLPDSMVNMVSLKVLNVESKVKLDESVISLLNIVSLPQFVVHTSTGKCSSNIILLQPTNPDKLMIDRLENVKSGEEAQMIKLVHKQRIEELTFQWTVAADRFVDDKEVLEKLVPPNSVKKLSIKGYMSSSFPDWLMDVSHHLPNLLEIHLEDFPNCNSLPPLGQLPNLECLSLCRMEGLEEWNTGYTSGEELMFPEFEKLIIERCHKLSSIKPCLPSTATCFEIIRCDRMLELALGQSSSNGGASFSSEITELEVRFSELPLHQWRLLTQLPDLCELTISSCSDLTSSPEIIQHLSSLQSLILMDNDQAELPTWLVELTNLQELHLYRYESMTSVPQLTNLKSLELVGCTGIRSLPHNILHKLTLLYIDDCPALLEWCESEENKKKLAHIERKHIRAWATLHRSTSEEKVPWRREVKRLLLAEQSDLL